MRIGLTNLGRTVVALIPVCVVGLRAQQSQPVTTVPRLARVASTVPSASGVPASSIESVTLSIYGEEHGGPPLRSETQNVSVDLKAAMRLDASFPPATTMSILATKAFLPIPLLSGSERQAYKPPSLPSGSDDPIRATAGRRPFKFIRSLFRERTGRYPQRDSSAGRHANVNTQSPISNAAAKPGRSGRLRYRLRTCLAVAGW